MSCFKLPGSLCTELEQIIAKFWWSKKQEERKIYLVSRNRMCAPKHEGEMSFKNLRTFNEALLTKQGWRLMQNENSLLHKVFKTRYFPHERQDGRWLQMENGE